jgi:hypothetical protein
VTNRHVRKTVRNAGDLQARKDSWLTANPAIPVRS